MTSIKTFLLFITLFILNVTTQAQIITTQFGQIQGIQNGSVYQFLGIPFAKPPVGTLRWKVPQNPDNWTTVLNTTVFAPECPQKKYNQGDTTSVIAGNEDCLYLNVWTPQITTGNLPVLVFIHGGGNQQGSASETRGGTQMYFGKNMATRGNCVVVTIQYRLGPLGFLVHGGLESETTNKVSGNYAILDQILSLKWVKNNISRFGGDPSKVMIFGESAGGVNVGNLLTTPLASGLFQRACIESAVPLLGVYDTMKNRSIAYVNGYTTTGTDAQKITYMRSLPFGDLVKNETAPVEGGVVGLDWLSVVDKYVFFDRPTTVFQSSNFNKVPLMIGSNSEEMSLGAPSVVTPAIVTALINSAVPVNLRTEANTLYPPSSNNTDAKKSFIGILTDGQFTSTVRRTAQCVSVNQTEPVWRYFFTHKHTPSVLANFGSYHGMELFFVFNTWENATLGSGALFSQQDDAVQKAMLKYWVNFANTGNPNSTGLETWQRYKSGTDCYMEIKGIPNGTQCGVRTAESNFWDKVVNYTPCSASVGTDEVDTFRKLDVYPNPTNGRFYVAYDRTVENAVIEVYDNYGQKLATYKNTHLIDLTFQPSGVYFVIAFIDGVQYFAKVIKA